MSGPFPGRGWGVASTRLYRLCPCPREANPTYPASLASGGRRQASGMHRVVSRGPGALIGDMQAQRVAHDDSALAFDPGGDAAPALRRRLEGAARARQMRVDDACGQVAG